MNLSDGKVGTYDVAIAGAGLAGASLALRLARSGARVALIDPGRFPRPKLCGEFLSPECWGVLERLGLGDVPARSGYHAIRRVRISTPRGRVLDAEVSGADGRPGIGLSRSALDDAIVRAARSAGADVFERTKAGGPIVRAGRVVGLDVRDAEGRPFAVEAAVTVAADGRHSGLVRRTGTTRRRSWARPGLFGLKRHFEVDDPEAGEPDGTVGLHLVAGGYAGTCRVEGTLTNLCALLPEADLHRHRGRLDAVAADGFAGNPRLARLLAAGRPADDWKAVSGVRVQVSKPDLPGLFYAGDCQGTVDPLGGQGMTMALLGAELLDPFVRAALALGTADRRLQSEYQAAWHAKFDRRIGLCRAFHHALVNPGLIDAASAFRTLAPRVLAACFRQTRDPASRGRIFA